MKSKKITLKEFKDVIKNLIKEELDDPNLVSFIVPEHSLGYFINGDKDSYEDEDLKKFADFENDVIKKYGNASFMTGDSEDDNLGFMSRSDIDNLGGNMVRLYIRPDKGLEEDFDKRPATDKEFIEIETPLNSKDYKIFKAVSKLGFPKSNFGERNYESLGKRAYFNFHKSEKDELIRRLNKLYEKYDDLGILTWVEDIEDYDNLTESKDKKKNVIKLSELRKLVKSLL